MRAHSAPSPRLASETGFNNPYLSMNRPIQTIVRTA